MAQIFAMFILIAFVIVKIECSLSVNQCEFGICEHPDMYPEEKIRKLLQESGALYLSYFDVPVTASSSAAPRAKGRSDRLFPNETLCDGTQRMVRPRLLKDDKNVTRFIVNIKNSSVPIEQVLRFETCSFGRSVEDLPCSKTVPMENNKYVTGCAQEYNVIKLLCLSEDGDKLEYGQFVIPSACVCIYSKF